MINIDMINLDGIKKLFGVFKIQLLVSITLAITLISVNIIKTPLTMAITLLGTLLGTFVLDMDYFIYAYFIEPDKPFSKTLKGFISDKDYMNVINHIYFNKMQVREKTLNSVLFQVVIGAASIVVMTSTTNIFIKSFVISIFANSIYKMADYYFDGKADEWFWELKETPKKSSILIYAIVMIAALSFGVTLF